MRRYTESSEKVEIEAMLPVEKKADWINVRKKRAVRASVSVRLLKVEPDRDGGTVAPFDEDFDAVNDDVGLENI